MCLTWREGEQRHEVFWSSSHVFNLGLGVRNRVGVFLQSLYNPLTSLVL
jgi:hypothetical protein